MERIPSADGTAMGRNHFFRIGISGLMVVVASCAFIVWSGLRIRDTLGANEILRQLHSGTAEHRRKAAFELSSVQRGSEIEPAFTALIRALGDEDAEVRDAAAVSLGSLIYHLRVRPPSGPVDPALLSLQIPVVTRVLVRLLSDPDSRIRAAAAAGLGLMAQRSGLWPTREQVAPLKDGSSAVRRQAAQAIWGSAEMALPSELVAALKDPSAAVRKAAAGALESFGPFLDAEVPTLLSMLESDEPEVRSACRRALHAAWPSPARVPTLIAALQSRDRTVRYAATELLGHIGPEAKAAIPALIAVLNEPLALDQDKSQRTFEYSPEPAWGAAQALGRLGPSRESVTALAKVLSPESLARLTAARKSERLEAAADGLGEIGPSAAVAVPDLIAAYETVLASKDHVIGQIAIPRALAKIAPNSAAAPDVVAILMRALDSQDPSIRLGAVEALGQFGKDAAAAIPKLRSARVDSDLSVSFWAAKALAALEPGSLPGAGESPTD
jgi:HEAT repeat protein